MQLLKKQFFLSEEDCTLLKIREIAFPNFPVLVRQVNLLSLLIALKNNSTKLSLVCNNMDNKSSTIVGQIVYEKCVSNGVYYTIQESLYS